MSDNSPITESNEKKDTKSVNTEKEPPFQDLNEKSEGTGKASAEKEDSQQDDIPGRRAGAGTRSKNWGDVDPDEDLAKEKAEPPSDEQLLRDLKNCSMFLPFLNAVEKFVDVKSHPVYALMDKLIEARDSDTLQELTFLEKTYLEKVVKGSVQMLRGCNVKMPRRASKEINEAMDRLNFAIDREAFEATSDINPFDSWLG